MAQGPLHLPCVFWKLAGVGFLSRKLLRNVAVSNVLAIQKTAQSDVKDSWEEEEPLNIVSLEGLHMMPKLRKHVLRVGNDDQDSQRLEPAESSY